MVTRVAGGTGVGALGATAPVRGLRDAMVGALHTPGTYVSSEVPAGSVFRTNYDWHSSVHAHWALLCLARTSGDPATQASVLQRLTPQALEAERTFLNSPAARNFEMPYGQAWLMLLTAELGRVPSARSAPLTALRQETAARLTAWLEKTPFPEPGGLNANYDSWLFTFLLLQLSKPGPQLLARLETLRASRIEPARAGIDAHVATPADFLHLPSILAAVDRLPAGRAAPALPATAAPVLPASITLDNCHTVGAAAVRLWPLALEAARGNVAARNLVHTRLGALEARPAAWSGDFDTVGHWVPQFMWMARWLMDGAR